MISKGFGVSNSGIGKVDLESQLAIMKLCQPKDLPEEVKKWLDESVPLLPKPSTVGESTQ